MKKILYPIVAFAFIATLCFLQKSTVTNTKLLATDPPILTFPPTNGPAVKPIPVPKKVILVFTDLTKLV